MSGCNVALTRQRSPVRIRSNDCGDEPTTVGSANFRSGPPPNFSGEIASHALWMQKEGYRRSTIESAVSSLKGIARKSDLLNPESVKRYLGTAE